ncbi:hypothetical protein [Croceivirga thetidis]|uniref:Viral A-type inclusion protein n=1 Tax=Croceivirga thetidis TaxID=2721623 RepID=A0ABX1GNQ3_9FLAO|nr:hypothetical protein [Croceivirga thetidis]NKI31524.1 hypothetical protein [Croceivirga thetidis]
MRKLKFLLVAFVIFACKDPKKETTDKTQMEEVMIIHDEVMDKMGHLTKLTAELKQKADSTETGMKYQGAMEDLQASYDAMMSWMGNFGNRFNSEEILQGAALTPQKQEWLNEEEEKIIALKEQFNKSISKAEKLLEK